jgi:hypothetical protein
LGSFDTILNNCLTPPTFLKAIRGKRSPMFDPPIGIGHGACDTDALVYLKPDDQDDDTFTASCFGVQRELQSLSPFGPKPIFECEAVNFDLNDPSKLKPLWFLGYSSKRYALLNIENDGQNIEDFVIRKATGHGAGHVSQPKEYDPDGSRYGHQPTPECAPDHPAAQSKSAEKSEDDISDYPEEKPWLRKYGELCKGSSARLMLDVHRYSAWCHHHGSKDDVRQFIETYSEIASIPQAVRADVRTANAWKRLSPRFPNIRPGMFYQQLPKPTTTNTTENSNRDLETRELMETGFYADAGRKLSLRLQDYWNPDTQSYEGLYRDDNGQFPMELFKFEPFHILPREQQEAIRESASASGDYEQLSEIMLALEAPRLKTLADDLLDYFNSYEYKSTPHNGIGRLQRRKVIVSGFGHVGKESNNLAMLSEGASEAEIKALGGNRIAMPAGFDPRH